MAGDLLMVVALNMLATRSEQSGQPRAAGFCRPKIEWLLRPEHFNFKLLFGTAVGVSVIVVLAVTCFLVAYRNQEQANYRAHTIRVIRLCDVIENDIAALENAQRGYLLTHDVLYSERFNYRKALFQSHSEELAAVIQEDSQQRERISKMREIVGKWVASEPLSMQQGTADLSSELGNAKRALGAPLLDGARDILHSVQREEQIVLNQRVHEQDWAFPATQVFDFIPQLERAVYEMQKEERGYVLSGDPTFIESYKQATVNFYTFQGDLSVLVADSPAQLHELELIRTSLDHWIIQTALPEIEAKRAGRNPQATTREKGEAYMAHVRRLMDDFAREQMEVYQVRSAAAARQQVLTPSGIGPLCALATLVMIALSCYCFVVSRRQFLPAVSRESGTPDPVPLLPQPNDKAHKGANNNGNGRVLIVDDEEAIRALVDFALGDLGYEVTEAETALKGVELYRESLEKGERFDLVIIDLTLPGGMDGKEALKKLIEIDPTVVAIVSSGYATDATRSRYEDLGFRGVITKPYETADLGRTVHELIQSTRRSSEPEYELQHAC